MPDPVTRDLLKAFEGVRSRLSGRLECLGDAEYLWEPAVTASASDQAGRRGP